MIGWSVAAMRVRGWREGLVATLLALSAAMALAQPAQPARTAAPVPADKRQWLPLAGDGVHDPKSPAIKLLQEPAQALSKLPPDGPGVGNQVRWVRALEDGYINPRTNIFPETKVSVLDQDIILNNTGSRAKVRFPHRQHTLWVDCSMCHEQLFKSTAGATQFSMLRILEGEQCGLCHGAVAFPLTECDRCHSVAHSTPVTDAIKGR